MKNFKKFTAFVLALCMLFSLSVAAFAAEVDEHTIYDSAPDEETVVSNEAATSGTIQNSGIRWSLDEKGWLTISGSGEAPVFQSADDQPWAAVRDQITQVWFDDMENLKISDLAYWFEDCINLTTAELPLAPVIGRHAFYNCPKLSTLTMYYGETVLNSIGEDAFWREADSGDTLYIAYIIGYEDAAHHNAVFIGTDEGGCPRHAHLRSTNSFGKAFRLNVESSDPRYSFHYNGTDGSLYVFEAPIDMLSYISMNPHQWQEHSYVACCGTSPLPVMQMLKPDTQIVYLCLDNDDAGHKASERMAEQLRERGVMTERLVPELKDWNADLLHAQKEDLAPCLSL